MPDVSTAGDYLKGLARAFGPDLVGMPVDAAQEALNLLIAGGGFVGHKLGLLKQPPDLLHGSPGTSDWWADKVNIPDNGSAAYTAGRLTPLGVALTKAASPAAAEALKKGMANLQAPVAASPGAGQRGAIRVGGDPELFAAHATSASNLEKALGNSKTLELYSPSIAISRGEPSDKFGSVLLIPKIGAFDPATSNSTLFNRDAWTSRIGGYKGKNVAASKRFDMGDGGNFDALHSKFFLENNYSFPEFKHALINDTFPYKEIINLETGASVPTNTLKTLSNEELSDLFFVSRLPPASYEQAARPYQVARDRLSDRFYSVRPEDTRLNENTTFGDTNGGPGGWKELAIKASPAFRSFKQFEESPKGAALLKMRQHPRDYQKQKLTEAFGSEGWIGSDIQKLLAEDVPRGKGRFMRMIQGETGPNPLQLAYHRNNFSPEELAKDMADPARREAIWRAATKGFAAAATSPSKYAELKVHGPAPITGSQWAGVIDTRDAYTGQRLPNNLEEALARAGVPTIRVNSVRADELGFPTANSGRWLRDVANYLQGLAGPSPIQPLR